MASRLPEMLAFTRYRLWRGVFLLFILVVLWFAFSRPGFKDSIMTSLRMNPSMKLPKLHPDVNIMSSIPQEGQEVPPHLCVRLPEFPKEGAQICVHHIQTEGLIGGKFLMENKLWEKDLVFQMQKVLDMDRSIVLLDVGSNIGVYTLWAAVLGHRVVAVDMMPANLLLLQRSVYVNRVSNNVTLVNNAVYFDHRTMETTVTKSCYSIACAKLNSAPIDPSKQTPNPEKSTLRIQVRTICLNDLVPLLENQKVYIKMDIENTEHQALFCADELFRKVNIWVVQMEWHRKVPEETVPILSFMQSHGYVPSRTSVKYTPVDLTNVKEYIDVFFLKKSVMKVL